MYHRLQVRTARVQVPPLVEAMVDKTIDVSAARVTAAIGITRAEEVEDATWEEGMGEGVPSVCAVLVQKVATMLGASISRTEPHLFTSIAAVRTSHVVWLQLVLVVVVATHD